MPSTGGRDAYVVYVGFDAAQRPDRTAAAAKKSAPSVHVSRIFPESRTIRARRRCGLELTLSAIWCAGPRHQLLAEAGPVMAAAD